jgi:hypothetical protein
MALQTNIRKNLQQWVAANASRPRPGDAEWMTDLLGWCDHYGFRSLPTGWTVAEFLLDLLSEGAPVPVLEQAANAIQREYQWRGKFLDVRPIDAALDIAEAQLSSDRILN